MRVAHLALLAAALVAGAAQADIYTWNDETGAKRLTNVAPPWYSTNESSRVRTRVLVNGLLVDDTGLPQAEREKLQARRAKAESLGRPGASPPAAAPAPAPEPAAAAAPKPPTEPQGKTPPPPVPPPVSPDAARSPEGVRRALEAQKPAGAAAEQSKPAAKPGQ